MVKEVDPDVLLLQETKIVTLNTKIKECLKSRNYQQVTAGDWKESQILYDRNKLIPIFLDEILKESIQAVVKYSRVLRAGPTGSLKKIFENRISIVALKRKAVDEITIFVSFHNVNLSRGKDTRERAVEEFCLILSNIHKMMKWNVVAGADLNQVEIFGTRLSAGVTFLEYKPTGRRKKIIDYILVAPSVSSADESPVALNFKNTADCDKLHRLMTTLKDFNDFQYCEALDHDPILLYLKPNLKPEVKPETEVISVQPAQPDPNQQSNGNCLFQALARTKPDELQQMTLSDEESNEEQDDGHKTVCSKCRAVYGAKMNMPWVHCDGCDKWFDLKCTQLSKSSIPDSYYCETCLETD